MMGGGFAIEPNDGKVFAPFDGEIISIFDTKHAIGLKSKQGIEILIHVGIDTVKLKGEHFKLVKQAGEPIKKGDLILEFDDEAIKNAGYSLVTPVIFTQNESISVKEIGNQVTAGQTIVIL